MADLPIPLITWGIPTTIDAATPLDSLPPGVVPGRLRIVVALSDVTAGPGDYGADVTQHVSLANALQDTGILGTLVCSLIKRPLNG